MSTSETWRKLRCIDRHGPVRMNYARQYCAKVYSQCIHECICFRFRLFLECSLFSRCEHTCSSLWWRTTPANTQQCHELLRGSLRSLLKIGFLLLCAYPWADRSELGLGSLRLFIVLATMHINMFSLWSSMHFAEIACMFKCALSEASESTAFASLIYYVHVYLD